MKQRDRSMVTGPLFSNIIFYTIPIILTSVLQLLFNAADLVIVGRYCGSISVAAVGATGAITNLIVNLFIGLSVGAGVSVAHGLGSRIDREVKNTIHTSIPLALISGVFLTVVGILFSGSFLKWMDTPENVLPLSTVYMQIYFAGITFMLLYNFVASILRAAGDTKSPLIYLSLSGVINVVLNIFFVRFLNMNVAGVALATTISQAAAALLVTRELMKRDDICKLDLKEIRIHKPQLIKIMRIGIPAGIQSSLFSISNVLIQSSVNSFGDVFMSGNAAAANIEGFIYVSLNAFHQTAVNFIGQNVGAGEYKRVKKILRICLWCVAVVGIGLGVGVYVLGPQLLSIYITDSVEAISYGMMRFLLVGLCYFLCGLMDVTMGALRGLGEAIAPMLISIIGVCGIRITWIYTLFQIDRFHTPYCLFASYPVSWTITFVCQLAVFVLAYKKLKRRIETSKVVI